jgi:hypothetical protein
MLRPPSEHYRERILTVGGWGSGKTYAWMKIADWHQKTGSTGRFWVLDTDDTTGRFLGTEFSHLTNVHPEVVWDWADYGKAMEKFHANFQPGDWLVIDMLSKAWDSVQEGFVDLTFDKGIDDYFIEARKTMKSSDKNLSAFDGWKDWSVINRMYGTFVNQILRWKGHTYACTPADAVNRALDEKDTVSLFGKHGIKPRGQKHTGHQFHSVLWLNQEKQGWKLTSLKDRGRPQLQGEDVTDFFVTYLMRCAGWKP